MPWLQRGESFPAKFLSRRVLTTCLRCLLCPEPFHEEAFIGPFSWKAMYFLNTILRANFHRTKRNFWNECLYSPLTAFLRAYILLFEINRGALLFTWAWKFCRQQWRVHSNVILKHNFTPVFYSLEINSVFIKNSSSMQTGRFCFFLNREICSI